MRLLLATLLALSVPALAQKAQPPAGEAPGPRILGTIGIGPQPYQARKGAGVPEAGMPPGSQMALKGFAIKVGEHGEAAVAYDLDLCRMVGAWVGKFTTPMNLMSRGEYPTALGEVAFTTGEMPGFLVGPVPAGKGGAGIGQGAAVSVAAGGIPAVPAGIAPSTAAPAGVGNSMVSSPATIPRGEGAISASAGGASAKIATLNAEIPTRNAKIVTPGAKIVTDNAKIAASSPEIVGNRTKIATPRAEIVPAPATTLPPIATPPAPAPGNAAQAGEKPAPTPEIAAWRDPRPEPFGPLPPGQARFRGFYVNGDKTILKWDIGGVEVLEIPSFVFNDGISCLVRAFQVSTTSRSLRVVLMGDAKHSGVVGVAERAGSYQGFVHRGEEWLIGVTPDANSLIDVADDGTVSLEVLPSDKAQAFRVSMMKGARLRQDRPEDAAGLNQRANLVADLLAEQLGKTEELSTLIHGGPARWPEPVVTTGELSKDTESAYVVDTIKLPDPNPWGAPMFVGGFDFFDRVEGTAPPPHPGTDGAVPSTFRPDAAVCTFHGDVFLVSGLDAKLEKVTWKRFATGLYHALGLKIVKGEIYVTCRDGIWRLKDLNGDGEADFYEAFNFDLKATKSFHEFVFDLQTDPAGNFYFAKAGPVKNGGRGFDQIMAHHGTLLRVSPDGGKLDVVATGFRAPNGIGVGPRGELTSGDNEGTWTPVCKINWIKPGGFYGVVPLSHREPLPTSYDPPLCWLPKRVDNSGGGQVWVPEGERWGPWGGKMLHLSYGQAALYGVMFEEIGNRPSAIGNAPVQGGVTKFPLQFQSGIMRARFSPADGQLYVAGLRGWQTSGLKNGCLQRVRYTGAVPRMPIELHVKKDGIELRFTASLDTQTARDPEAWHVEQWRYLWSAAYGSPELSAEGDTEQPAEPGKDGAPQFTKTQMGQAKHDPVVVKSVTIGTDDRTVFLEIPGLKPVMQMSIKYDLKTAEGQELRGEVVNTIHSLGAEK